MEIYITLDKSNNIIVEKRCMCILKEKSTLIFKKRLEINQLELI